MFVAMVASECAPVAQAGGLGEVVFGLSRELELRGNTVEIVLPKYDCMRYDRIYGLTVAYDDLWVPWFSGAIHCSVWFGFVEGRKCFFIEPHSQDRFFERGHMYGSADDVFRFAFLSKAALEFMLRSNKRPDVIHCHDWQTALVPVLLYEMYRDLGMGDQRVCYTVHNFGHQGIAGEAVLWATGLTLLLGALAGLDLAAAWHDRARAEALRSARSRAREARSSAGSRRAPLIAEQTAPRRARAGSPGTRGAHRTRSGRRATAARRPEPPAPQETPTRTRPSPTPLDQPDACLHNTPTQRRRPHSDSSAAAERTPRAPTTRPSLSPSNPLSWWRAIHSDTVRRCTPKDCATTA